MFAATLFVWLMVAGCQRQPETVVPSPPAARPASLFVPAKVLTIRTDIPGERAFVHLVIFANGKVRIGNEMNQWRLFDFQNDTITFVNETERSFRTETLQASMRKKRIALAQPVSFMPRARYQPTGQQKVFEGIPAHQHLILLGDYKREMWISDRVLIEREFFAMQLATEPVSGPYAGVMRDVFDRMVTLQGFPVYDRSEMPYDGKRLVIEKRLTRVEQKNVPLSWITVPSTFRDLDAPATTPSAGRPSVSSTPRDRNVRGAG